MLDNIISDPSHMFIDNHPWNITNPYVIRSLYTIRFDILLKHGLYYNEKLIFCCFGFYKPLTDVGRIYLFNYKTF